MTIKNFRDNQVSFHGENYRYVNMGALPDKRGNILFDLSVSFPGQSARAGTTITIHEARQVADMLLSAIQEAEEDQRGAK